MADTRLQVIIEAVDHWSNQVKDMGKALEAHKKILKTAGLAVTGFGVATAGALAMATKAAADEQAGIQRLSQAMANVGVSYDSTRQSLEAYIDAQQQKTSMADNDQRDALGALIAVTSDYHRALSLLPLAMDVAAAKGMDLTMASELVGRVAEGNVTILQRYGVQLREGASATEALGALQAKFGGQAEAYGKTVAGQWALLKNNLGDVAESIGTVLLPAASKLAEVANGIAQGFKNMNPQLQQFVAIGGAIAGGLALIVGPMLLFISKVPAMISGIASLRNALVALKVVAVGEFAIIVAAALAGAWALSQAMQAFTNLVSTDASIRKELKGFGDWVNDSIAKPIGDLFKDIGQTASVALEQQFVPALDTTSDALVTVDNSLSKTEQALWFFTRQTETALEHQRENWKTHQAEVTAALEAETKATLAAAETRGQLAIALAEQDEEIARIKAAGIKQRQDDETEAAKKSQETNDRLSEAAKKLADNIKAAWNSVRESLGFAAQTFKSSGLSIQEIITGWAAVSGKTADQIIADLEAQGVAVEDVGKNWDKLGVPLMSIVEYYTKIRISIDKASDALRKQQELQRRQVEQVANPGRGIMPTEADAASGLAAFAANVAQMGINLQGAMPTLDMIMQLAEQLWRAGVPNPVQEAIARFGRQFNIPGYAQGGVVPGPVGRPSLAVVHGGETITPAGKGGMTIVFNGPVYGLADFRDKVNQVVRDTILGGGYRGVLKQA